MQLTVNELRDFITLMRFELRKALHAKDAIEAQGIREELTIARDQLCDALAARNVRTPALRVVS